MERSTIREDAFLATLAERDKENAELKIVIEDRDSLLSAMETLDKLTQDGLNTTITELRAALNEAKEETKNANSAFSVTHGRLSHVLNALDIVLRDVNKHGGNNPYVEKMWAIANGETK